MTRLFLRTLAIATLCVGLLAPMTLAAEPTTSQGLVTVIVKDAAGRSMPGNWFLYQGVSNQNLMVRNGTKGETFLMPEGQYFLVAQTVYGYASPLIINANPQALTPSGHISFEVKYPSLPAPTSNDTNTYDAERILMAQEAAKRASRDLKQINESNADEIAMIEDLNTAVFIPEEMAADTETVSIESAPLLITATSFELAATGPGMIGLLAFSSMISLYFVKRKEA